MVKNYVETNVKTKTPEERAPMIPVKRRAVSKTDAVVEASEDVYDEKIARTVFFDHPITEDSSLQLRASLMALCAEDSVSPIRLILGSVGGGLYESLAIYDTIKMIPAPIIAVCNGKVMSGGIIILLACKERVSTPNTTFMIHHGHTALEGNVLELKEQVEEISTLNDRMIDIIIKRTYISRAQLDVWLVKDHYLNAREAEKCGLVERIITELTELN